MFRVKTETRTQPGDASSANTKTSRLPTLAEEDSSEAKAPKNVPVVREEADGKDEAAEVQTHNSPVEDLDEFSSSSSSSRTW